MGLLPSDVAQLNNAISGVGETFAGLRKEKRQQQALDIEQDLRQRMLAAEMRRMGAEENRAKLEGEGHIDQWLQASNPDDESTDGALSHYTGPASGLGKFIEQGKTKGTTFTPVDPPDKKPPLMITAQHPDGTAVQVQVKDIEALKKFHDELKAQGFNAPKAPASTYGPVQAVAAAKKERASRAELERQLQELNAARSSGGPVGSDINSRIDQINQAIEQSKADEQSLLRPRYDPSQFQDVTETEQPLDPTAPKTVTRRKVPVGAAPAATPTGKAPPAPKDPKQRKAGQKYATPKGEFTWTGSGWTQ